VPADGLQAVPADGAVVGGEQGDPPLGHGVTPAEDTTAENPKPDEAPPGENQIPCGDGECDDAEQANAQLCPRDCGAELPASGDWCGDGICDALEEGTGNCAQDCS
jgi:hypothetical protein